MKSGNILKKPWHRLETWSESFNIFSTLTRKFIDKKCSFKVKKICWIYRPLNEIFTNRWWGRHHPLGSDSNVNVKLKHAYELRKARGKRAFLHRIVIVFELMWQEVRIFLKAAIPLHDLEIISNLFQPESWWSRWGNIADGNIAWDPSSVDFWKHRSTES